MFNKNMSVLRITDPAKKDFLVQESINTRKAIMQKSINERLGDAKLYRDSTKLFKPLLEKTESSSKLLETIVRTVKALPSTITESMKAITFPQYPALEAAQGSALGLSIPGSRTISGSRF
jgi:hypothetical protein